jgi:hypothetical protein
MGRGQRGKKTNKGRQAFAPASASGDASTPQAPERYAAIFHKRHGWIDAPEGGYFEPSDSRKMIEMYDPALEAEGLWGTNRRRNEVQAPLPVGYDVARPQHPEHGPAGKQRARR